MNLDDHAERAAADLRRQVDRDLDISASRAALDDAVHRRRSRAMRVAGQGLGALAAVAVLALIVSTVTIGPGGGLNTDGGTGHKLPDIENSSRSAAILNALPRSPIDGRSSWRLPVVVKAQNGLHDLQKVTVYGRGFEANQSLGMVQCSSEADTGAEGVGACQLAATGESGGFGAVTYATASNEGTVVATFVVHRFITTPNGKQVDCQSAAERCLIGVGAVSNYDQSGGAYIGFSGAPPFAKPVLTLDPAGPYTAGQSVHTHVSGYAPGRAIRVQQCRGTHCEKVVDAKTDASGVADVDAVLQTNVVDAVSGQTFECEDRCTLRVTGIGVKGASSAPQPDPVPLTFTTAAVTTTAPVALGPATTAPATSAPAQGTTTTTGPTSVPVQPDGTAPVTTTSQPPPTSVGP